MGDEYTTIQQEQSIAYIPFFLCNSDPFSEPADFGYEITSRGHIGDAIWQTDIVDSIFGGDCADIYAVLDAEATVVCDFDTLTVVAWDIETGTYYDTFVTVVHVVESMSVPLLSPWMIMLTAALLLLISGIMRYSS